MAMTIGTNAAALTAARSLHESSKTMQTAMERLSTGSRINSAADDAAGLALTSAMKAQSASLAQATENIANGQALTTAIESSLNEVGDMLERMRTLAVQAASDTYSNSDRTLLNSEMVSLRNELTALTQRTEFAGQKILDGSFVGKVIQVGDTANETIALTQSSVAADKIGGYTKAGDVKAAVASTTLAAAIGTLRGDDTNYFNITGQGVTGSTNYGAAHETGTAKSVAAEVNAETHQHGVTATAVNKAHLQLTVTNAAQAMSLGTSNGDTAKVEQIDAFTGYAAGVVAINAKAGVTGVTAQLNAAGDAIILTDIDGDDIVLQNRNTGTGGHFTIRNYTAGAASGTADDVEEVTGDVFGIIEGEVTLTSNSDFTVTENAALSSVTAGSGQISYVSTQELTTQAKATSAISIFDGAIDRVAAMKADLGALSNRLGHALDSSIVLRDMTEQAISSMADTDYSVESANLAKAQVQQQVGAAMLAQANASPQLVLQLIQ
ncbi:MAG: hypothetical protein CL692_04200 [Cellvibrionales bacterium]|nr:hypothetical protein [Cellvibrionales bacterium]